MRSDQHNSKQIRVLFGEGVVSLEEGNDAQCSDVVGVDGTVKALTAAMFAEVMKSARAALALR